jgi:hypothetical protein
VFLSYPITVSMLRDLHCPCVPLELSLCVDSADRSDSFSPEMHSIYV